MEGFFRRGGGGEGEGFSKLAESPKYLTIVRGRVWRGTVLKLLDGRVLWAEKRTERVLAGKGRTLSTSPNPGLSPSPGEFLMNRLFN
jgi:hypothetical protein